MVWSVAERFGFDAYDLPIEKLRFYYKGVQTIAQEEKEALKKK